MNRKLKMFSKIDVKIFISLFAFILLALSAPDAFSASPDNACQKVEGFFGNLLVILKVISAGIVTVAIVFSGYQIAFAHKRLSDVAPVLIGGLLIGGAATIAAWFVDGFDEGKTCGEFKVGYAPLINFDFSYIQSA